MNDTDDDSKIILQFYFSMNLMDKLIPLVSNITLFQNDDGNRYKM
jgi:hypothetical protein